MFKTIKRIWERIYFGVYPVLKFCGRLFNIIMLVGCIISIGFYFHQSESRKVQDKVNLALDKKWAVKADEAFLSVHFKVTEIPFIFGKEDVKNIVQKRVGLHNYQVTADRNNEKAGFVVKKELNYSDCVRVYYTDDVAVNGEVSTTLWLLSENYVKKHNLQQKLQQYEIPIIPK